MKLDKRQKIWVGVMLAVIFVSAVISMQPVESKKDAVVALDQGKLKYSGDLVRQKFNGQGFLHFHDGSVYKGTFKNGYFNGPGKYTAKDGWKYVGNFKNGQAEGQGTLTVENGAVYQGKFKDGVYQTK